MFYDTASAAFKDLPYEVIEYYCSGWTGYLEGVETYEDLEVYARDFGIITEHLPAVHGFLCFDITKSIVLKYHVGYK